MNGFELLFDVEARAHVKVIGSTRYVAAHEELDKCLRAPCLSFEVSISR